MFQRNCKKKNQGFSLVEMVVVVLILGILAVTVTPQIMNWINKAKVGKDEAYAGEIATVVEMLALEHIGENDLDSNEAVYTLTNTVEKTSGGGSQDLSSEIIESIGANMCRTPEQSGKTKFTITITPSGKSVTVKVIAE
jgi:prepilin-type N-terminal cleavage/methylation domain-containing protein